MASDQPEPNLSDSLAVAVVAALASTRAKPLDSGLYLVSTPIGHLADITLRALAVLATADRIFCEDSRHSRKLLDAYGLTGRRLDTYHEHNAQAVRPVILADLTAGRRIALISDAGTPLVSDPGYKLVTAAVEAGHRVIAVPGASAVLAALAAAGLPTDTFHFAGFLPPKAAARRARLAELAPIPATLVLFEAPGRVADLVADIATVMGDRAVVVARELTKLHEQVRRGAAPMLAVALAAETARGEHVVLVAPAPRESAAVDDAALRTALTDALESLPPSAAARAVAEQLGVARSRAYDMVLAIKGER